MSILVVEISCVLIFAQFRSQIQKGVIHIVRTHESLPPFEYLKNNESSSVGGKVDNIQQECTPKQSRIPYASIFASWES